MSVGVFALTSLARVKAGLINLDGTVEEDTEIERLIDSVTSMFEAVTDRRLKSRTYKPSGAVAGEENMVLSGNQRSSPYEMYVPEWPLTAVSAITIQPADLGAGQAVELVSGEDWTFSVAGKITLIDGDVFEWGENNIEVTFIAGYLSTHKLWPALEQACIDQVRYQFKKIKNPQDLVTSISDQGGSVNYFQGPLLPQVRMLLENTFRRRELA